VSSFRSLRKAQGVFAYLRFVALAGTATERFDRFIRKRLNFCALLERYNFFLQEKTVKATPKPFTLGAQIKLVWY